MTHYVILRADFSVWKRLMYRELAEAAVRRDVDACNPVLFVVEVQS
ncbi:hypothetical protein [Burkholderia oklahomensis]|uniref:Uncharacterized protein n=1 Tax=Burkholderia oklahomensis TaxID=342113 RepID=A0AAI8BDL8_9BURK|nr:hypothetical protein [Burkholderia oklahomensis]AIO70094.1 hypothetical protein DM82_4383 [Burkholderia oklahomensis]QPS39550.1 hypothetical protein I6G57_27320 [Burkholderia oklahomensis]